MLFADVPLFLQAKKRDATRHIHPVHVGYRFSPVQA